MSVKPASNGKPCRRIILLGLLAAFSQEAEIHAMGKWIEKQVSGDADGEFWKDVEKAVPVIQKRADAMMQQLGYDTGKMTSKVYLKGEGLDETWTVAYWFNPSDRLRGDMEAYLNNRGAVKRVSRFENGTESLLFGKDQRVKNGMTADEVKMRVGEPDRVNAPPRSERQRADQIWIYEKKPQRTMRTEIWFKEGKVVWLGRFG